MFPLPFKCWKSIPPSLPDSEPARFPGTAIPIPSQGMRADHDFSTLRLLFVHIGAAMALFLATTDATIVSTSDLAASQSQYTWVGAAYMLTQTAFQPALWKIIGFNGTMLIFSVGSLLCGAAQVNLVLFSDSVLARALAGIGGGGIVSSVWVLTSEIVEPSTIAGPLLGGLFSCNYLHSVYLNLPVCLVALVLIALSLRDMRFGRAKSASWHALALHFDFVGLLLFMAGTGCLVVGFSFAMDVGWNSPSTLSFIISGPLVLVLGGFYEAHTKRDALFPPSAFNDFTVVIILAVNGLTPLDAGIQMLPYSLGSSLASMPAAWFIGHLQKKTGDTSGQKWIITMGLLISTLGFGLLTLLDDVTSPALQIVLPLIAGTGNRNAHWIPATLATGTSAFFLVRFTGATIGLALAGLASTSIDWTSLHLIEPTSLRIEVLHAVAVAIKMIWVVCAPLLGLAFLISLFTKRFSIEREVNCNSQEKQCAKSPSSVLGLEA
ncbi:hypothetical protein EDC04DRAFT_2865571 [Pisolithus marmoratus]|nr:hypothetical protein EDC04DRAFT_2865571 [Pisolithus marmoratus]